MCLRPFRRRGIRDAIAPFLVVRMQREDTMARKMIDCGMFPSEANCSLKISGTEDEVVKAATEHAVSSHGHTAGPELESEIRSALTDEPALAVS
jgi:predicted small metal-binding protein